ncbi:sso1-syntaxin-related protein [Malassezia pachydermatis]|uniref:Sso1-syntaxin-related protein n=1 Tax=Malassezia pachydermatis TaxID=77020 RepID=A0A0M8MKV8_9BASI|nr:sso1-syntaxin-related protein [Malassezia pachydermatis]KOS13588.1 sso1-syntaxin-related protein [Malassezia pachydermatis]
MRAQQASTAGGYTSPDVGAGNNGYGDHLYPTQQSTGMPYAPPSGAPPMTTSAVTSTGYVQESEPTASQTRVAPPVAQSAQPLTAMPEAHTADAYEMQSYAPASGAVAGGSMGNGSYAIDMPSDVKPANTFFGQISVIQDTIRQIDLNVNRISELHSRSLNNVGEAAQMAAEQELSSVAQQTSSMTNQVKNSIKALEVEANSIKTGTAPPEGIDRNVRLTQIGAAKNRFKETILRYQEVEKAYRTKYRQRTERQLRIVKPDATQAEIQSALDGEQGGQQIFAQALMSSNRQGEAQGALREVQERHSDIQRIERTITELAALFQEMSILVEQQDEQLNVIKDHAYHTEQEIQAGRQQTDKAVVAARRRRKRRWICFWLLVILIIIIIVVVVGAVCGSGVCKAGNN